MEDRIALITGGSRGIGRAIALRFAKAKTHVLINFFQNRTEAEKTAQEAKSFGIEAHLLQADLKDETQIQDLFKEIRRLYGRLDILIHNAASGVLRSIVDIKPKHWDWVMGTNARSFLVCGREAASLMHEGGKIISLSSLGSRRVIPKYGAIGISKAALESLTRYLAVELGPKGINVNTISAGAVATEIWDLVPDGQNLLEEVRQRTPSGRLVTPEDVAEIAFFLSSPEARMIQGQIIVVDGGYSVLA